ncbi:MULTISPECIES: hypothetical protein [unclassified Streptomyces]|uniref:hypothetical protein n=1 Tax=unclassified Streptomyces TaxID=2593676 RepID=UPI00131E2758|nr:MULTISPECIES: hypothetical protein [unclassified Streptomyces]
MATEDPAPGYTMIEDDCSIHVGLAERINQYTWESDPDSGTGAAVTALFPAGRTRNHGDLVTLREDGSIAFDMDGTYDLPEPFDRSSHAEHYRHRYGSTQCRPPGQPDRRGRAPVSEHPGPRRDPGAEHPPGRDRRRRIHDSILHVEVLGM